MTAPDPRNPSPDRRMLTLAMPGVPSQPLACGSANVAATQVVDTGLLEACRQVLDDLARRLNAPPAGRDAEFDDLARPKLAARATAAVRALPGWGDCGLDPAPLAARLAALQNLAAGRDDEAGRPVREAVAKVVQEAFAAARKAVDRVHAAAPVAFAAAHPALARKLEAVDARAPAPGPLARLGHLLARRREFEERRADFPAATFARATQQFAHLLKAAADAAVEAGVDALVARRVQRARDALTAHMAALASGADRLHRHLLEVGNHIDERRRLADERRRAARASAVLLLAGRPAPEVLAAALARTGSPDRGGLAGKLWGRWDQAARADLAARGSDLGPDAPAGAVFPALPPDRLADLFLGLVAEAGGDDETAYPVLERYGLAAAARFLYARAAPTARVGARAGHRFNVALARVTVVRLPAPVGPRDADIRDRLLAELREVAANLHATDAPDGERDVSVFRLEWGWPLGLDRTNRPLLAAYAAAHGLNHLPHLLGILDTPDGTALPGCLGLADRLKGD